MHRHMYFDINKDKNLTFPLMNDKNITQAFGTYCNSIVLTSILLGHFGKIILNSLVDDIET